MNDTLVLERVLPHTPEEVWEALTSPSLLAEWLLPVDKPLQPGAEVNFTPQPEFDLGESVRATVLEANPPYLLSYSWQVGQAEQTSVVTWQLTPLEGGTRLRLRHSGLLVPQALAAGVGMLTPVGLWLHWPTYLAHRLPKTLARRTVL